MKVEAYIICWNEIETIHLTVQHYQKFCDKIHVFDNWSNDGTFEKCFEMGCEVERFGIKGVLDDSQYLKLKNNVWKESSADWVIIVDSDEIIYHPNILEVMQDELSRGSTVFRTHGWNVFSEQMPKDDFLEITKGQYNQNYSKQCVFSPRIKEIDYIYGCHVARPKGEIVRTKEKLALLHYRNIGGWERLRDRHKIYRKRLSEKNKRFGLGAHYLHTDEQREREFKENFWRSGDFDLFDSIGVDKPIV